MATTLKKAEENLKTGVTMPTRRGNIRESGRVVTFFGFNVSVWM